MSLRITRAVVEFGYRDADADADADGGARFAAPIGVSTGGGLRPG